MPAYIVSPPDETEWSLSPAEFAERLGARWPEAELGWVDDPARHAALQFEVPVAGASVRGWFDREGNGLHLGDGPLEQLAEVALWFRSEVPPDQPLIFYDEGYTADVELRDEMSAEQLVERYLDLAWKAASDR